MNTKEAIKILENQGYLVEFINSKYLVKYRGRSFMKEYSPRDLIKLAKCYV